MDLHPRDDLSALLDGELPDGVAEQVYAHVLTCADCAAELDAARHARRELRELPAVEPPPGFLDAILGSLSPAPPSARSRRQRRAGWVAVQAAVAIAIGLALVASSGRSAADAVAPSVGTARQRHAATLAALSAGVDASMPDAARPATLGPPYLAPAEVAGYRLMDAFQEPLGVQLLYEKPGASLSVFEQAGDLDAARLPGGAVRATVGGHSVWEWDDGRVIVLHRGDVVLTLVGDESVEPVVAALPGSGPPLTTRLRRACGDVLRELSPVG